MNNLEKYRSGPLVVDKAVTTGLSGNEIYCLHQKGFSPGNLVIGNSVFAMGFVGGLGATLRTIGGGEVTQVTQIIHEGRQTSLQRMVAEAQKFGGIGITGVTSELVQMGGNIEFLSVGSCLHKEGAASETLDFSSSADGQELYCQIDAGFKPLKFAFGNVAYSIGIGGGIGGALRSMARGEVTQYSEIFNKTRHLALNRIMTDAKSAGGNCVVGIETSIVRFQGMQEMIMIGTASRHPSYHQAYDQNPATSDLTCEEMWNLVHIGYMPLQMVLGVSVYSLGVVGGFMALFRSLVRGEIGNLTTLVYEARENALARIRRDALAAGADDVVGIKTYVYDLGGGMIEFLAMGTAVKKVPGMTTLSPSLPPQAVIVDKETFINTAEFTMGRNLNSRR